MYQCQLSEIEVEKYVCKFFDEWVLKVVVGYQIFDLILSIQLKLEFISIFLDFGGNIYYLSG